MLGIAVGATAMKHWLADQDGAVRTHGRSLRPREQIDAARVGGFGHSRHRRAAVLIIVAKPPV
jgi:hypothetical protein